MVDLNSTTVLTQEPEWPIDFAYDLMALLLRKRDSVMLWGTFGIGKSSIVYQLAEAEYDGNMIEFRTNIREPVDVRGVPVADMENGTTRWFVPDELPREDRDGKRGILFVDEINTGTLQMMAVMMGLILDKKV